MIINNINSIAPFTPKLQDIGSSSRAILRHFAPFCAIARPTRAPIIDHELYLPVQSLAPFCAQYSSQLAPVSAPKLNQFKIINDSNSASPCAREISKFYYNDSKKILSRKNISFIYQIYYFMYVKTYLSE